MKFLRFWMLSVLLLFSLGACREKASNPPFWDEIQRFRSADNKKFPPANGVLFTGSSSFRLWTDLEDVFKEYQAINRGFGGATLIDLNRYADDVIFPYRPRQIVIYCGENDLPADTVTAPMLLGRFKVLMATIRSKLPNVPIVYISIKPSIERRRYIPLIQQCNHLIKDYLKTELNTKFIDVFSLLLTKDGRLRPELYRADRSHLNEKGYEIWRKAILPHLIKDQNQVIEKGPGRGSRAFLLKFM